MLQHLLVPAHLVLLKLPSYAERLLFSSLLSWLHCLQLFLQLLLRVLLCLCCFQNFLVSQTTPVILRFHFGDQLPANSWPTLIRQKIIKKIGPKLTAGSCCGPIQRAGQDQSQLHRCSQFQNCVILVGRRSSDATAAASMQWTRR